MKYLILILFFTGCNPLLTRDFSVHKRENYYICYQGLIQIRLCETMKECNDYCETMRDKK